jgi:superoxide reductase
MQMAKQKEIYKCEECGNIIEVLHAAGGKLLCCGQEMTLLKENTVDAAQEKHIPVIEQEGNTYTVKVGSMPHPMEENHYIEFIELLTKARVYHTFLDPGQPAEASFDIKGEVVGARSYCNLHGLWKNE